MSEDTQADLTVAYMAGFREAEKAAAERIAVTEALLAQRERLARLAEDYHPASIIAREIAAAIRKDTP